MPMADLIEIAKIAGMVIGPAGAAWWSVKKTLNGTVERVHRIETTVDGIRHDMSDVRDRTARLEGRMLQ